jgi:hypothetical protein
VPFILDQQLCPVAVSRKIGSENVGEDRPTLHCSAMYGIAFARFNFYSITRKQNYGVILKKAVLLFAFSSVHGGKPGSRDFTIVSPMNTGCPKVGQPFFRYSLAIL